MGGSVKPFNFSKLDLLPNMLPLFAKYVHLLIFCTLLFTNNTQLMHYRTPYKVEILASPTNGTYDHTHIQPIP